MPDTDIQVVSFYDDPDEIDPQPVGDVSFIIEKAEQLAPYILPENRHAAMRFYNGEWIPRFFVFLADSANPTDAARKAGVSAGLAYKWRRKDTRFKEVWALSMDMAMDEIQGALVKRAKEKSDLAAIALLNAYRPEVFKRPNVVQHQGEVTNKHQVQIYMPDNRRDTPQIIDGTAREIKELPSGDED